MLVILPQNGLCPLIIPHIIWLPDISPSLSTWGKILYFNNLIKVPDLKYIKKQQQQKQTNRKTKNLWTVFLGSFEHWMTLYTIHILGQRRPCFPLPFHMMFPQGAYHFLSVLFMIYFTSLFILKLH